jgi:hypothetical protein
MAVMKSSAKPKPDGSNSSSSSIWTESWGQAVSEYRENVDLPPPYEEAFKARSSAEVVSCALASHQSGHVMPGSNLSAMAEDVFIAAVAIAETHPDLVQTVPLLGPDKIPPIVRNHMATFLRYAESIDKLCESLSNMAFPAAVLFAAIRVMISIGVKNMNLFNSVKAKLEDFTTRLRRLDIYLAMENPTEAIKLMLSRVMIDIIRFCGLVTKYLKSQNPAAFAANGRKCFSTVVQNQKSA